jgi:hypothetical protein
MPPTSAAPPTSGGEGVEGASSASTRSARLQRPRGLSYPSRRRNHPHQFSAHPGKPTATRPLALEQPELELSSLPSPPTTSATLSFLPTDDCETLDGPSASSFARTGNNAYLFDARRPDRSASLPPSPPRNPPPQRPRVRGQIDPFYHHSGRGFGATLRGWLEYMKAAAQFPLLRSSPAVGTGSYGALPTSYQGSGASSETLSDDDHGASTEEEEVGEVPLTSANDAGEVRPRARRRRGKLSHGPALDGYDSLSDEAADSAEEEAVDMGEESEEDENDPADNSPYPEVRASVLATDDESLSINTPRMWILSLLFTLVGSSTNLFFSLRYPSISITPVIALLLAHPLGKLWDQVFPEVRSFEENGVVEGKGSLSRLRIWLGQGRWNRKEHACVYISSNVSFGFAFATDVSLSCFRDVTCSCARGARPG